MSFTKPMQLASDSLGHGWESPKNGGLNGKTIGKYRKIPAKSRFEDVLVRKSSNSMKDFAEVILISLHRPVI
jgi:hypothetical protein